MINTNDLKSLSREETELDTSNTSGMEYWSTLWGVSTGQITDAINQTGSRRVKTIEEYLLQQLILDSKR